MLDKPISDDEIKIGGRRTHQFQCHATP
jgi:hypothetical protein